MPVRSIGAAFLCVRQVAWLCEWTWAGTAEPFSHNILSVGLFNRTYRAQCHLLAYFPDVGGKAKLSHACLPIRCCY